MFKMAYNWNIDGIIQPNQGKLQHKMVLDAHNSQTNQGKLEFQYFQGIFQNKMLLYILTENLRDE